MKKKHQLATSDNLSTGLFLRTMQERRATKLFCAAFEGALVNCMPGYDHEPDRAWDEYEWERFLQQQDHKTEKYMELLEKYLDHPQRDQIIAREMGWT
ncbi:MAG: hypothetical protein ABI883_04940, partial [Chthoniobacterales bacterium]